MKFKYPPPPPPLTLEYLGGGKTRNFWEIFYLTNILLDHMKYTPPIFFGLRKDVGGRFFGCNIFSLLMVWYTLL